MELHPRHLTHQKRSQSNISNDKSIDPSLVRATRQLESIRKLAVEYERIECGVDAHAMFMSKTHPASELVTLKTFCAHACIKCTRTRVYGIRTRCHGSKHGIKTARRREQFRNMMRFDPYQTSSSSGFA